MGGKCMSGREKTRAFTLLELEVTLFVLGSGLLGVFGLLAAQNRQLRHVEAWCADQPTLYLVSQADPRMRQLGAPAAVEKSAGGQAWRAPVSGDKVNQVALNSLQRDKDGQPVSAAVRVTAREPPP
jgi:hypothetical protein